MKVGEMKNRVLYCSQSIQYTQSNFYPVPTNGIMTTGNWTNQHTLYMATKPVSPF